MRTPCRRVTSKVVISATKLYEGQPTLLCEATMNYIPVIFPNSGGINEFLPKNYKFLYDGRAIFK